MAEHDKSLVRSQHPLARFDPKSRRQLVIRGLLALSEVEDTYYYSFKGEEPRIRGCNEPRMEADAQHLRNNLLTKGLTRVERLVIVLYYYEGMTVKEIGAALVLSESRVTEMHASIIARLKARKKTEKSTFEATRSSHHMRSPRSSSEMSEFTDRVHKIMAVANAEARRLKHEYIGTEHLLLALVQEAGAVCRSIFLVLNITGANVRSEIEKMVTPGPGLPIPDEGRLPQTPCVKRVIHHAIEEARNMRQDYYVATEHILLGLLRETDGIAYEVLAGLGLQLNTLRERVLQLLEGFLLMQPQVSCAYCGKQIGTHEPLFSQDNQWTCKKCYDKLRGTRGN